MIGIAIIILWIIGITAFSLFGAWYAKKYNRPDAIIGLYVAFVTISNIIVFKIASFNLGLITFFAPVSVLIFSVTFLMTDIVNEKFGRKETHRMIFIAFLTQVAVTLFTYLAISFPPAPFWDSQEIFEKIFGFVPRAIFASWVAFLISENADAYIFAWFKNKTKGKHLWARNVFSSIPSMALDTIIFVILAFYGIQPLLPLITGVLILKWIVGVIDIPFMYLNRFIMYR